MGVMAVRTPTVNRGRRARHGLLVYSKGIFLLMRYYYVLAESFEKISIGCDIYPGFINHGGKLRASGILQE